MFLRNSRGFRNCIGFKVNFGKPLSGFQGASETVRGVSEVFPGVSGRFSGTQEIQRLSIELQGRSTGAVQQFHADLRRLQVVLKGLPAVHAIS